MSLSLPPWKKRDILFSAVLGSVLIELVDALESASRKLDSGEIRSTRYQPFTSIRVKLVRLEVASLPWDLDKTG